MATERILTQYSGAGCTSSTQRQSGRICTIHNNQAHWFSSLDLLLGHDWFSSLDLLSVSNYVIWPRDVTTYIASKKVPKEVHLLDLIIHDMCMGIYSTKQKYRYILLCALWRIYLVMPNNTIGDIFHEYGLPSQSTLVSLQFRRAFLCSKRASGVSQRERFGRDTKNNHCAGAGILGTFGYQQLNSNWRSSRHTYR